MPTIPSSITAFAYVLVGALGLLFGSFANVLIWRIPRGESIVSPGSHCPRCNHPIRWFDNIPVISWLLLRAKCRDCGEPIPWRYPAVELASGVMWLLAAWRFGLTAQLPLAIIFFYMLLVLAVVDIDTRRLPTPLVAVIAVAGLAAIAMSLVTGIPFGPLVGLGAPGWLGNPGVVGLAGFGVGAGTAILIATAYSALRRIEGLGFGDVRLLGAMGLVLGPYVLLAYAMANIFGVFGAIPMLLRSRRPGPSSAEVLTAPTPEGFWERDRTSGANDPIDSVVPADTTEATSTEGPTEAPLSIQFGPFLALAGVITTLWGPALWSAYLRLLGMA